MSFFKRAVVGALERREEVRDANQVKYESDVARGITKLEEAEDARAKNELIVRNRKKIITPIGINVEGLTGKKFSEAVILNAFKVNGGDATKTTNTLVRMAEYGASAKPTTTTEDVTGAEIDIGSTRDYTDLSGDTTKALQDSANMISTTSTQLPSQQKALSRARRPEGAERYGGGIAGNVINTLFGGVSGPSVRDAVRDRYSSMFRTPEEGEQAYTNAMDYMEELRTTGEPTNIPDIPPVMMADILKQTDKASKIDKFESQLGTELNKQLKFVRDVMIRKVSKNDDSLASILRQAHANTGSFNGVRTGNSEVDAMIRKHAAIYNDIVEDASAGAFNNFNYGPGHNAAGSLRAYFDTKDNQGRTKRDIALARFSSGNEKAPSVPSTRKKELKPVVDTQTFGTKIDRDTFESETGVTISEIQKNNRKYPPKSVMSEQNTPLKSYTINNKTYVLGMISGQGLVIRRAD